MALPSAKHEAKQHRLLVRFRQLPRQGPVLNNNYTRPSALAETRGCCQLASRRIHGFRRRCQCSVESVDAWSHAGCHHTCKLGHGGIFVMTSEDGNLCYHRAEPSKDRGPTACAERTAFVLRWLEIAVLHRAAGDSGHMVLVANHKELEERAAQRRPYGSLVALLWGLCGRHQVHFHRADPFACQISSQPTASTKQNHPAGIQRANRRGRHAGDWCRYAPNPCRSHRKSASVESAFCVAAISAISS